MKIFSSHTLKRVINFRRWSIIKKWHETLFENGDYFFTRKTIVKFFGRSDRKNLRTSSMLYCFLIFYEEKEIMKGSTGSLRLPKNYIHICREKDAQLVVKRYSRKCDTKFQVNLYLWKWNSVMYNLLKYEPCFVTFMSQHFETLLILFVFYIAKCFSTDLIQYQYTEANILYSIVQNFLLFLKIVLRSF